MKGYGQFCPVAKAAEVFTERWTPLIVRELMCGSHRFNELRRGNPLMSPSMLSQRLKQLERAGVVERRAAADGSNATEYFLTPAGESLGPIVIQLGRWGMKYARSQLTPEDYDPALLMWDMKRRVDAGRFPARRSVVWFEFCDAAAKSRYWFLIVDGGEADICLKDPGHDVDLKVQSTCKIMADIWMGDMKPSRAMREGLLEVTGNAKLKRSMDSWLGYSVFAGDK